MGFEESRQSILAPQISRSDLPDLYHLASRVSQNGQDSYKRWILINLVLVILSALLSAAVGWTSWPSEKLLTIIIAGLLLGATLAKYVNQRRRGDSDWFDGRAVAESVKTNSWRFMMGVPPFDDEAHSESVFASRMDSIRTSYVTLGRYLANIQPGRQQLTARMRSVHYLPWRDRREIYLGGRLQPQIDWYSEKSRYAAESAKRWTRVTFYAEIAGIVIALSTFVYPSSIHINLVGAIAAVAAASQAWTQVCRHAELSRSYDLAQHELSAIKVLVIQAGDEQEFELSCEDAEQAVSREHTLWVAKRNV